MLILSRKINEKIMIGDDISITIIEVRGDQVKLGVEAPRDVQIFRQEVFDAIKAELMEKEISLATERIIKGVSSGHGHEKFELAPPKHFVIFKVRMEEIAEVAYSGEIKREKSYQKT